MQPNSITLIVLLFLAGGGAIVAAIRLRRVAVKVLCAGLAMISCSVAGVAGVNDYYGYYQTWSQLAADLSGSYAGFASAPAAFRTSGTVLAGRLRVTTIAGARSGIKRNALVYLPPQYFQRGYAHTTFPVVELVHGTPGSPSDWVVHLGIVDTMDRLISEHLIGPMILVMPATYSGSAPQECVNAPHALDDTYMTYDVRSYVLAHYRASRTPAEWGIAGFSSGGYCAANLALRHRSMFGAAGVMDGYFRPGDGPAATALHHVPAAENANDPLLAARNLGTGASPLPAFWLAAGTGNAADIAAAQSFATALHGVEQVTLDREPNASHNYYAWAPAVPRALSWMWGQLAPPSLRVRFPIAGPVRGAVIGALAKPPKACRHVLRASLTPAAAARILARCPAGGARQAVP